MVRDDVPAEKSQAIAVPSLVENILSVAEPTGAYAAKQLTVVAFRYSASATDKHRP